MSTIRAVIFDLGHTVWDFAPSAEARGLTVLQLHARLETALGPDAPSVGTLERALSAEEQRWLEDWNSDRLEQPPTDVLVTRTLVRLGVTPSDQLRTELTAIAFGTEFDVLDVPVIEPDGLAAIASLDVGGLAMGCITNTVLLEEGILDLLWRLGLLRYFRSVVVSSAMGYRKPHPSLFLRALDELDVAPNEALFVGDRLVDDIGGAQGVGMRAVLTHQYRQEPLDGTPGTPGTPDAVIRRLSELPMALEQVEQAGKHGDS